MKKMLYIFFIAMVIFYPILYSETKTGVSGKDMKIKLIFSDTELTATMDDTPAAEDFISLLPLTLELKDYNGTEKISSLPRKLSLKDAPSGWGPSAGDITYYAPWGNLAIFYRDFSYSTGLIKLGRIDSGADFFKKWKESKKVRIEILKQDKK